MANLICKGLFGGSDIEPGTFHLHDNYGSTPPQDSGVRCISDSEEPTLEEKIKDDNASAKDDPTGQ